MRAARSSERPGAIRAERDFRVGPADKQRAVAHYHLIARDYARAVERGALRHLRRRERGAMLAYAQLDDARVRTVLDVGCGAGFYALAAKRHGKWVHAVDLAPGMVECVRPHVDQAEVADVERLALPRRYDLVLCAGVLEFVTDPARAFENLCALVAPGGRLVVLVPSGGWRSLWYRLEKALLGVHVNAFRPEWLEARAARSGLRLGAHCRPLPTNIALRFERPGRPSAAPGRPDARPARERARVAAPRPVHGGRASPNVHWRAPSR